MHQKITGQVDSTYTAQSHSLVTLKDWHSQNSHVSKLVLSSQVIFPIFATGFLILYFIYLIESGPTKLGEKLNSQADSCVSDISDTAKSKVWIIVTINLLFTIGNIIADLVALIEYLRLPKEIESYFRDSSEAFAYLRSVPFTMLIFDVFSFVLFILAPSFIACGKIGCCKGQPEPNQKDHCKFKLSDLLYTLLSSLSCIATHSYHIIFAFINNPYHATSVLLLYTMVLFVIVVIFQKIFYFVLKCFRKCEDSGEVHVCAYVVMFFLYIAAIAGMIVCIGLTVAVLLVLPINNAIDQASNEIYAIYQASVTVFAALITFQVFFREANPTYAVLIKAADKSSKLSTNSKKWEDMSEKEKELRLGDALLKHINFKPQELGTRA